MYLGHPKGVGRLTSDFLRGGGMDVFWNDPIDFSCLIRTLYFLGIYFNFLMFLVLPTLAQIIGVYTGFVQNLNVLEFENKNSRP